MRRRSTMFLLLLLMAALVACGRPIPMPSPSIADPAGDYASHPGTEWVAEGTEQIDPPDENKVGEEDQMEQKKELILSVNGNKLNVSWEDNRTVDELIDHVQNANIVVETTLYGGFEQVGSLPRRFSRNDVQTTTVPGDIVLYSGDQLVVFFGSNRWSYTMLGHIEGLTSKELAELLESDSAVIEITSN